MTNYKIVLSAILVAIFTFTTVAQETERKCNIKSMIGSVKIRRGASVNWIDARPKMPLKEKDAIRTFVESEVELETSEGTVLKIGENSTVEMSRFIGTGDVQSTKVKVLSGSILSNVKKLVNTNSSFEFETPTATAAIRGTTVGLDVNKAKTVIKVYEGRVLVVPSGAKVGMELKENQMTSVAEGQKEVVVEKLEEKAPEIISEVKPDSALTDSTVVDSTKIDSSAVADTSAGQADSIKTETSVVNDSTVQKTDNATQVDSVKNSGQPPPSDSAKVKSDSSTVKSDTLGQKKSSSDSTKTKPDSTALKKSGTDSSKVKSDTLSGKKTISDSINVKATDSISVKKAVTDTTKQKSDSISVKKAVTDTIKQKSDSISVKKAVTDTTKQKSDSISVKKAVTDTIKQKVDSSAIKKLTPAESAKLKADSATVKKTAVDSLKTVAATPTSGTTPAVSATKTTSGTATPAAPVTPAVPATTTAPATQTKTVSTTTSTTKPVTTSTSTTAPATQTTTPTRPVTTTTAATASVKIVVTSPADRMEVEPQSPILITGTVSPAGASVTVNGKAVTVASSGTFRYSQNAPDKSGELSFEITGTFNSSSQSVTRTVAVKAANLTFAVSSPGNNQEFNKTQIPVSGTATPGAEVTVTYPPSSTMKFTVLSTGQFSGQISIPNNAEGTIPLQFTANLEGRSSSIDRSITYMPDYKFTVTTPVAKQIVNSVSIPIKGIVLPASSQVSVNGTRMVTQNGMFNGMVRIPDEEGDVNLEIEVVTPKTTNNEVVRITYKRPPDLIRPVLQGIFPDRPSSSRVTFTVLDRTIDEEITFYKKIDGVREYETGSPSSPFSIALLEGTHTYEVYAEDKAKNQSQVISKTLSFLANKTWSIRVRKPSGTEIIDLPPSTPDDFYKPKYSVELSIENIPDDDMKLIREVNIKNTTSNEFIQVKNLTSNYIEREITLVTRKTNVIVIEVIDINNQINTQTVQIIVR
jgi:hypothetical protein